MMSNLITMTRTLKDQDSRFLGFSSWYDRQIFAIRETIKLALSALLKTQLGEGFINLVKLSH